LRFGKLLRDNNFRISPPELIDAIRAVELVGIDDATNVRAGLKCALARNEAELGLFDRLFDEFWRGREPEDEGEDTDDGQGDESGPQDAPTIAEAGIAPSQEESLHEASPMVIYSPVERLKTTDLKDLGHGQDNRVERIISEIVESLVKRIKKKQSASFGGAAIDFRKLLRRNAKYGGEILELPVLRPKPKIRRLVFLCDVSGSMNPYLDFMLRFIKELNALPTKVETFVFATRLTRITDLLRHGEFEDALAQISQRARDWSGGTRMGECLTRLLESSSADLLRPSTVVVIHSDGWDRGDPQLLEQRMRQIRSKTRKIIWVNPLLGGRGYEPTCRGMSAALPFVDSFLSGHNLESLEKVAGTLAAYY
jgi:hypothetical protein